MRPGLLAAVSLVAAILGAGLVLVVARAAGWLHRGPGTTTVVQVQGAGNAGAAAVVVAKPLTGNGFAPAQIYRARSAGVVTIYSTFGAVGSADASSGLGSGFVVGRDGTILTSAHVVTTAGAIVR